jgi:hypothetical protein
MYEPIRKIAANPHRRLVLTVLRKLDGVSYWVIEDQHEIFEYVDTVVRREWESDLKSEGKNPEENEWLRGLSSRKWHLEVVDMSTVKLNEELMHYSDSKTGYDFALRLQERKRELTREIKDFAKVILPVILRAEDNLLMDGYCRYATLKEMNLEKVYAYIGRL